MKKRLAKQLILITIILMDFLSGMEFDLFVPSFPNLQSQFHLSPFLVEALLSANFVGYCLCLMFVGGLADRYGRKPIILLGLLLFIIGSASCLWATSYPFLLIGRFFQGVGIAGPAILSFLIIADSYSLKRQQYLMAMLNAVMNISVGIAPVLGSYITLYFHWQGNFTALFALGLLVLIMTQCFIPHVQLPGTKSAFSLRSYGVLLKSKPLMLLLISLVFLFVPYWVFVGMSPILYMKDLGVSLTQFGYYQGALAMIFAFGSLFLGFIINKHEQKNMLHIGTYILIMGLICIAIPTLTNSGNPLFITLAFIPFILSQVIPSTILYPLCLNFIAEAKGRVSAMLQGARLVLTAFSLQIAGYFYQGSFQNVGIIMLSFIVMALIGYFVVIHNRALMKFPHE